MLLPEVEQTEFSDLIRSCSGRVYLETEEGDRLIVNSRLTAKIGIETILKVASHKQISIHCDNQKDRELVRNYLADRA